MIGKLPYPTNPKGRGTEYMVSQVMDRFFHKFSKFEKYNWVVLPDPNANIDEARQNKTIIWVHVPARNMPLNYVEFFTDETVRQNTVAYIVQSEFHKIDIAKNFDIPHNRIYVLNNAFEPLNYIKNKQTSTIQLIYVADSSRGLLVLLHSFREIKDKNIRLKFHISCECDKCFPESMKEIYENDSRIEKVSYSSKEVYRENIQNSHLAVYPCNFEETACISAMEMMSAGLKYVSTGLGALPETTMGYAEIVYGYPADMTQQTAVAKKYIKIFKKRIIKNVKQIRRGKFDPTNQIKAINERFSWGVVEKQWASFHAQLPE